MSIQHDGLTTGNGSSLGRPIKYIILLIRKAFTLSYVSRGHLISCTGPRSNLGLI